MMERKMYLSVITILSIWCCESLFISRYSISSMYLLDGVFLPWSSVSSTDRPSDDRRNRRLSKGSLKYAPPMPLRNIPVLYIDTPIFSLSEYTVYDFSSSPSADTVFKYTVNPSAVYFRTSHTMQSRSLFHLAACSISFLLVSRNRPK